MRYLKIPRMLALFMLPIALTALMVLMAHTAPTVLMVLMVLMALMVHTAPMVLMAPMAPMAPMVLMAPMALTDSGKRILFDLDFNAGVQPQMQLLPNCERRLAVSV